MPLQSRLPRDLLEGNALLPTRNAGHPRPECSLQVREDLMGGTVIGGLQPAPLYQFIETRVVIHYWVPQAIRDKSFPASGAAGQGWQNGTCDLPESGTLSVLPPEEWLAPACSVNQRRRRPYTHMFCAIANQAPRDRSWWKRMRNAWKASASIASRAWRIRSR